MVDISVFLGDCVDKLDEIERTSVDVIYLDPPFFTQKIHHLSTRDGKKKFSFDDIWQSNEEYAIFLADRLEKMRGVLKETGSVFCHCDRAAVHLIRFLMDAVFGEDSFRSEIIWYYRRWSNAQKGLLPAHQNILFYSKTSNFKFNPIFGDYSPSTNLEQILQKRVRDDRGKAVYARDKIGNVISNGAKKGVPLCDVWDIPFLNPKARERVSYPTQKPILLLERIIELVTDEGDMVLDPFCGSGTTLVAAKLLNRNAIGIDVSEDAVALTESRLANPVKSTSPLMEKGRDSYAQHDSMVAGLLDGLDYAPVHRNSVIDGVLKKDVDGRAVLFRVQRSDETLIEAALSLRKAAKRKGKCLLFVVQTKHDLFGGERIDEVFVVPSTAIIAEEALLATLQKSIVPLKGERRA